MVAYRIKHLDTGLYYRPCVGVGSTKTNLGINGKLYHSKPTIKHCVFEDGYLINVSKTQIKKYPYLAMRATNDHGVYYIKSNEESWKIEEV